MGSVSVVLASRSPRRSQLLDQIGVAHEVLSVELDEARAPGEAARDYVERVARDKALLARERYRLPAGRVVLAADTAVVLDDEVFGKPRDERDCMRMLGALSGRTHEVLTAVAVHDGETMLAEVSVSRVTFREIDVDEGRRYWASGEPADKAGSYAIQGLGAVFAERLEGSHSGVMGLPLCETARLLQQAGIPVWQEAVIA